MSFTNEMDAAEKRYRGLFELTIEEAASKLHSGLWDSDQATVEQILQALIAAIVSGKLRPKFGAIETIGSYSSNPPILDAFKVARWAERHGLELESNGAWSSYIHDELEIQEALDERLEALRALQDAGKERSDFEPIEKDPERQRDQLLSLMVENSRLKAEVAGYQRDEGRASSPRENPKSLSSLLKIVLAIAIDGYGFDPKAGKSPVPTKISNAVMEKLGESIDADTTRAWLQAAAKEFSPKG